MTERRLTDERIEAIYDDMEAKNWEHEAWEIRSHINWLEARVKEQGERADNLQRAYELKIDDLRRETLRASTLQEALNKEHQALTELWERHEKMRRALSADTEARMGELPKIKKMYVEAEADAIHWRKKYREVQQIRAAERTAAQKTAEELEQAEQREKKLRRYAVWMAGKNVTSSWWRDLACREEIVRRARAALAVPEPTEPPPERCLVCGWTGTHSASCPLAEPTEPPNSTRTPQTSPDVEPPPEEQL